MLKARQILVIALALAAGAAALGCGQRGPLYLPKEPSAAQRATLPQTLNPVPLFTPADAPAAPASSPASSTAP